MRQKTSVCKIICKSFICLNLLAVFGRAAANQTSWIGWNRSGNYSFRIRATQTGGTFSTATNTVQLNVK